MRRMGWAITALAAALGVGSTAGFHPAPRLVWNASASVPIGLYAVKPAATLHIGELVAVAPPEPLASYMSARRYLPKGVPLLKHVAALPGQTVCRAKSVVTVDGRVVGTTLDRDHLGRHLPVWRGCRVVRPGEVFLLNPMASASFDGRYFGPLPARQVIGEARPVWTSTAQ